MVGVALSPSEVIFRELHGEVDGGGEGVGRHGKALEGERGGVGSVGRWGYSGISAMRWVEVSVM